MSDPSQSEYVLTPKENRLVEAWLTLLPDTFKTPQVAAMFSELTRNSALAQQLADDAATIFRDCGVALPPGARIHVHRSEPDSVHIVLPVAPPGLPQSSGIDLSDDDLISQGLAFAQAKEKTKYNQFIPKGRDIKGKDDGIWDHGDLGPGSNWYNSGNAVDGASMDDA